MRNQRRMAGISSGLASVLVLAIIGWLMLKMFPQPPGSM